jgi:hypothetical protein
MPLPFRLIPTRKDDRLPLRRPTPAKSDHTAIQTSKPMATIFAWFCRVMRSNSRFYWTNAMLLDNLAGEARRGDRQALRRRVAVSRNRVMSPVNIGPISSCE